MLASPVRMYLCRLFVVALLMDESRIERLPGFETVRNRITHLIAGLAQTGAALSWPLT